jgi:hypothetical protein
MKVQPQDQEIAVILLAEALCHLVLDLSAKFPVFLRHSLVSRIDHSILDLLMHLNVARFHSHRQRLDALKEADCSLNFLRILIRLSFTRKLISIGSLELLSEKMNEIGRMLNGWIKHTQSQIQG